MLKDLKNRGPPPPISFNTNPTIGKKPYNKQESLKVDINTQPGDISRETALFYMIIFKRNLANALLNSLLLLNKTLKDQNLTMVSQYYAMTNNILAGEELQFFEQIA